MNKLIGLIMGAGIAFGGAFCASVNASYQQTVNPQQLEQNLQCSPSIESVIQTKYGPKELKITLNLPQELQDHIYRIVEQIKLAVQRLYKNDCYIRTDDIRIVIKRTDASMDKIEYMPAGNIIEINLSQIDINSSQLDKVDLTDAIAHGLMYKYSFQTLGYVPYWLAVGFFTQLDEIGCYERECTPPADAFKHFNRIEPSPYKKFYTEFFYDVNQKFINSCLKQNNITLGELIIRLQPLVRGKNQAKANFDLRKYLLNNGGQKILEQYGFVIEPYWITGKLEFRPISAACKEIQNKNCQEKKPKKVEPKSISGKHNKK